MTVTVGQASYVLHYNPQSFVRGQCLRMILSKGLALKDVKLLGQGFKSHV